MKRFLLILASLVTGCSSSLADYVGTTPEFSLPAYFSGQSVARGILQDYKGRITRHFCVDINGQWDGNKGTLHEQFYFNDGEQQTRIWRLNIDQQGNITGTADDVVGVASGRTEGAALRWNYTLQIPVNGSTYDFAVDDRMVQTDNDRLMNRSY